MKWYPADWRADPRLRVCSLAARGLWADLIAYMHEGQPYGHLTLDGRAPDLKGIASLVARPVPEVKKALAELEDRNVFSRSAAGAIVSRRMVRDKAKAEKDRENGSSGGNPTLVQDKGGVNPPVKAQKLEARGQEETGKSESLLQTRAVAKATRPNAGKIFDEEFWPKYPKRDGANPRKPARIIFITAVKNDHDPAEIIAGLNGYVASLRKSGQIGGKYVAQAVTWLNQARWQDYAATAPPRDGPVWEPPEGAQSLDEIHKMMERANNGTAVGEKIRDAAGVGEERTDRPAQLRSSG